MFLRSRPLALLYRLIGVVLIAMGLIRLIDPLGSSPVWVALLFYTTMSNVLALVWMIAQSVWTSVDIGRRGVRGVSTISARWGAPVMMVITVTMLVYLIVLVPASYVQEGDYEPFTLTDNLIHIIAPLLLIGDWLLFAPKGRLRRIDPLLWLLIPLAYLVFAFVYGALGGRFGDVGKYPYPFMNVDILGVGGVALQVGMIAVGIVVIGYVYVVVDKLLARAAVTRR